MLFAHRGAALTSAPDEKGDRIHTMEKRALTVQAMWNSCATRSSIPGNRNDNEKAGENEAGSRSGSCIGATAWGTDQHMQLGRRGGDAPARDHDSHEARPVLFADGTTVCSIACGTAHCAALVLGGNVYCWGSNAHGQLGFDSAEALRVGIPTHVVSIADIRVSELSCGSGHTVALDCNGKLWAWGQGSDGQLGHGGRQQMRQPTMVPSTVLFTSASAGDLHTAAVSEKGQLFTFGSGTHGQLGHNSGEEELRPREVVALYKHSVKRVCCGPFTTGAILEDGRVTLCGYGENLFCTAPDGGHLDPHAGLLAGIVTPGKRQITDRSKASRNISRLPVLLDLQFQARDLAFGRNHVVALSRNGSVYCWGSGSHGQCGHGQLSPVFRPRLILDGRITSISAGRYHSAATDDHGFLLTWGAAEQGQLGNGLSTKPQSLPVIVKQMSSRPMCKVSCGPHHTVVTGTEHSLFHGEDVVKFMNTFDIATMLKRLLVERQGGQGTGVTQRHLYAVRAAQNGDASKISTLLEDGLLASNSRTGQARLHSMLGRVGLQIHPDGTIARLSRASNMPLVFGLSKTVTKMSRGKEKAPAELTGVLDVALTSPPSSPGDSQVHEIPVPPHKLSRTPDRKSTKPAKQSFSQGETSSTATFAEMRRAFFVAESRRRSDIHLERGHRPMSARAGSAADTRTPSRPPTARSTAESPRTPRTRAFTNVPTTPKLRRTTAAADNSWTAADEDTITQAGMIASRIAVYSDQRELMNRSKRAMAAAIRVIGRNTGTLQDNLTVLRAELDKYSVVRRKRQAKLDNLKWEYNRDLDFGKETEEKHREMQKRVQGLEHARYVADISILESLENCENEQQLVSLIQEDLFSQMLRYAALSKEVAMCESIHARLTTLTKTAVARKEHAKFTLKSFEVDLLSAQQSLRMQTADLVRVRHGVHLAMAKKKAEEWNRRRTRRKQELKVIVASLVQDAKHKFLQNRDRRQQRNRESKIASAEEQLYRLASATGLKNPCSEVHELVLKYEQRDENSRNLKATSTKLLARLGSRQQELSNLEAELQKFGQKRRQRLSWRHVDDLARELDSARFKCGFKSELLLGEIMQCHELMALFDSRYDRIERVARQGQPDSSLPKVSPEDVGKWRRSIWGEEENHPWVPTPEKVMSDETLLAFEKLALLALTMHACIEGNEPLAT